MNTNKKVNNLASFQNISIGALLVFALSGFYSASTLLVEQIHRLKNPSYKLNCDVNVLLSCGNVMDSQYASIAGIPWALVGVAGYPAVMLLALFLYFQKGKIPLFIAIITQVGSFGAFCLSTVFMFLSSYVIMSFCPWCLVSALSSTNIFFALTYINLKNKNYGEFSSFPKLNNLIERISPIFLISVVFLWFVALFIMMYLPYFLIKYDISLFLG